MPEKVADWSGWVDNSYSPPSEIPLWEYQEELDKGYSMFPASWEYIGFEEESDGSE